MNKYFLSLQINSIFSNSIHFGYWCDLVHLKNHHRFKKERKKMEVLIIQYKLQQAEKMRGSAFHIKEKETINP